MSTLNQTFAALADPTRRAILAQLALKETTVSELAEPFKISLPAISKHLKYLEEAGLMKRRVEGRIHYCSLNPAPMKEAAGWIASYRALWEEGFNLLERYLIKENEMGRK